MDSPPEYCFCGRKTVESHEFWFCSTECARQDSLRSLGGPNCHYRNVVRDAYVRAGAPELQPRRTMSTAPLRTGPCEQRGFANPPPPFHPPTNPSHRSNMRGQNMAGLPAIFQVPDKVLTGKVVAGEPPVVERRDRSRWEGFQNAPPRGHPAARPGDHSFEQISLDAIALPEHVPARSLGRVPTSINGATNNTKKSAVTTLLNFGRSRKGKEVENPERVFGHPVNADIPPVRKDARRLGRAL